MEPYYYCIETEDIYNMAQYEKIKQEAQPMYSYDFLGSYDNYQEAKEAAIELFSARNLENLDPVLSEAKTDPEAITEQYLYSIQGKSYVCLDLVMPETKEQDTERIRLYFQEGNEQTQATAARMQQAITEGYLIAGNSYVNQSLQEIPYILPKIKTKMDQAIAHSNEFNLYNKQEQAQYWAGKAASFKIALMQPGFSQMDFLEVRHIAEEYLNEAEKNDNVIEQGKELAYWKGRLSGADSIIVMMNGDRHPNFSQERSLDEIQKSLPSPAIISTLSKSEERWFKLYDLLIDYYQIHQYTPPYKTEYKGVKLGLWLSGQRSQAQKGNMPAYRQKLLEDIIPDWLDGDQSRRSGDTRNDAKWLQYVDALSAYYKENQAPPRTKDVYQDVRIGTWISHQRNLYEQGKLSPERIEILNQACPDWKNPPEQFFSDSTKNKLDAVWLEKYNKCLEFYQKENHFPSLRDKIDGITIGAWFNTQKVNHRKGMLSPERIQKLKEISPTWDSDDRRIKKGPDETMTFSRSGYTKTLQREISRSLNNATFYLSEQDHPTSEFWKGRAVGLTYALEHKNLTMAQLQASANSIHQTIQQQTTPSEDYSNFLMGKQDGISFATHYLSQIPSLNRRVASAKKLEQEQTNEKPVPKRETERAF